MHTGPRVDACARLARLTALLVATVACWQVRGVIAFDFVEFDDGINLVFNPHLGPLSRDTIAWALTDTEHMRRYVPLGWLGFAAVYGFSGLTPAGYHAAGAALQVLNSALVFALILTLVRRLGREADDRVRIGWSGLAALTWSLHPLRAETVGWASGLFYGLAGAGALLSVLAYLRAWTSEAHRGRWVAAAAALQAAGTLAYPMSLGVVVLFPLLDLALARGGATISWRRLLLEKLWFVLPALAVLGMTVGASHAAPEFWVRPPSWGEFGIGARVLQAAAAWGYYVWRPWWPFDLTPVPTWLYEPGQARALSLVSLGAVAAVSGLLLAGGRRWRGPALLWFAHAGLLAPMLGFFEQPYFPSDRYHTLAGVVLAVALALAATRLTGLSRGVAAVVALAAVGWLGRWQQEQVEIWRNTDTLMARIVERAEHPTVKSNYQGRWINFHTLRGDHAAAAATARRVGLSPDGLIQTPPDAVPPIPALHGKLGLDFARQGRRREAQEHFEAALRLVPNWSEAAYNLAMLHALAGAPGEALRWWWRAEAPGRGTAVPAAARQRLLLRVAEGFFVEGRPRLAVRTAERARLAGGGVGATPDLERDLRAALARYNGDASR